MKICLWGLGLPTDSLSYGLKTSAVVALWLGSSLLGGCAPAEPSRVEAPLVKELSDRPADAPLPSRQAVTIGSLMANQSDETVTISGTVAKRVPILEGWLYQVSDDTGSLWVLSDRSDPAVGELATVQGVVRYEAITVGEIDASEVYLEEQSYRQGDG